MEVASKRPAVWPGYVGDRVIKVVNYMPGFKPLRSWFNRAVRVTTSAQRLQPVALLPVDQVADALQHPVEHVRMLLIMLVVGMMKLCKSFGG